MTGSWRGTQNRRLIKALDDGRSVAEVARELRKHPEAVRRIYESEQQARALRERFRREREQAADLP